MSKKAPPARGAGGQDLRKTFGANVRAARENLGLTLDGLRDLSRHSRAHISNVEAGKANVTLETAQSFARALGVSILDLLSPHGVRVQDESPPSGPAPVVPGSFALELPSGQALEVAQSVATLIGRAVNLIDPATREVRAIVRPK